MRHNWDGWYVSNPSLSTLCKELYNKIDIFFLIKKDKKNEVRFWSLLIFQG